MGGGIVWRISCCCQHSASFEGAGTRFLLSDLVFVLGPHFARSVIDACFEDGSVPVAKMILVRGVSCIWWFHATLSPCALDCKTFTKSDTKR
jgi:hypothetical protein